MPTAEERKGSFPISTLTLVLAAVAVAVVGSYWALELRAPDGETAVDSAAMSQVVPVQNVIATDVAMTVEVPAERFANLSDEQKNELGQKLLEAAGRPTIESVTIVSGGEMHVVSATGAGRAGMLNGTPATAPPHPPN